ncbi:MAG: hypothetical protein LLF97_12390 [Planctomycetaceae bacterium]|nr:hypothetical protein [Planctomycetaceae bacterium]
MKRFLQHAAWTWLVLLSIVGASRGDPPTAEHDAAQPAKPFTVVTVSPRTTHLTEPLRPDGYPDYVAALDQRLGRGVTPDQNAVVLLCRAMGPIVKPASRVEYFRKLGIAAPPEKGDYFVDLFEFDRKRSGESASQKDQFQQFERYEQLRAELGTAMTRPWSPSEHPQIAEWLAANEKPLALLVEASKRPKSYIPAIGDSLLEILDGLMPIVQSSRAATRALTARAMLRINQRQWTAAQEDLLACHRLARLVGRGSTLLEMLFAIAIDNAACDGDRWLIEQGDLSAQQARDLRDQIVHLPTIPSLPDRLAESERYFVLDGIITNIRRGYDPAATSFGMRKPTGLLRYLDAAYVVMVNWDDVLVQMNEWVDRYVDALRRPTRRERTKALIRLQRERNQLAKKSRDSTQVSSLLWNGPRKAATEQCVVDLLRVAVPGLLSAENAEDRWTVQRELTQLSLALAAYRADRGTFPQKLAELAPKYVSFVPQDLFSENDAPLHYQRRDRGFLLYSVGLNGRDDGGKTILDAEKGEDYDDLAARISTAR